MKGGRWNFDFGFLALQFSAVFHLCFLDYGEYLSFWLSLAEILFLAVLLNQIGIAVELLVLPKWDSGVLLWSVALSRGWEKNISICTVSP